MADNKTLPEISNLLMNLSTDDLLYVAQYSGGVYVDAAIKKVGLYAVTNDYLSNSSFGKIIDNCTVAGTNGSFNALVVGDGTYGAPGNGLLRMNGNLLEYHNGATYINPLARANHSGTQTASTISDFNTSARSALAAASNDCLLGSTYAYLLDANVAQGQINFAIDNTNGRVVTKFRLQNNGIVSYTFAANGLNANFFNLYSSTFIVGNSSINASAILQADATNKGFLPPRMTLTQCTTGIASPATGLIAAVTDVDSGSLYFRDSAGWNKLPKVNSFVANSVTTHDANGKLCGDNQFYYDRTNFRVGIGMSGGTPSYPLDCRSTEIGAILTSARFSALPSGSTSSHYHQVILNNEHATNRKSALVWANNGTNRYALLNDENGNGTQDFGLFCYHNSKMVWKVDESMNFYPAFDNSISLGRSDKRWSVGYAMSASFNTSDTRCKTDITTNILGTSEYSLAAHCNSDYYTTAKAIADTVIRYKLEAGTNDDGSKKFSEYDSIGYKADELYNMGFPGAAAFKHEDNKRIKFSEEPSISDVDIYMLDQTQITAFNSKVLGLLIARVEAIESAISAINNN